MGQELFYQALCQEKLFNSGFTLSIHEIANGH